MSGADRTRSAAQERLQASLDEVSLGGNHPIQVIVPRAGVRDVLAEIERLRELAVEVTEASDLHEWGHAVTKARALVGTETP